MESANDAQLAFLREVMAGRRCEVCGEPTTPGTRCANCDEKHDLLRQAFPKLHGDA